MALGVEIMIDDVLEAGVLKLEGPILVFGAGGFVGANLFHAISSCRDDVFAGVNESRSWRLDLVPSNKVVRANVFIPKV